MKGSQKVYLRGLAHALSPVVQVGKQGFTQGLAGNLHQALLDHELVKVRFVGHKEERKEIARQLAEATGSELAGQIGHVAIFYRPHPDPEKRTIVLPA
jgi:RNA-binding protein